MSVLRFLLAQPETKAALGLWAVLPTVFLFFALTLAVDPSTHLKAVRFGVVVLDRGVETPQGRVVLGSRLLDGLRQQLPFEAVQLASEADLRAAVLARAVAAGLVLPADLTASIQASQPVKLQVVRSEANDPFTNALAAALPGQLAASLNRALPALAAAPGTAPQPTVPLVSAGEDVVARTPDYRFATMPAAMVLPVWMATVAFAALISRAGDTVKRRRASRVNGWSVGIAELTAGAAGAAIVAAVTTLDVALFTWRWDLDFLGLFGILWLGLGASAWLMQGFIRLFGIGLGAALGVLALFVQQPLSGAAFPPSFAPGVVRWAEGVVPLRFLVEGLRNVLIGGSTTPQMASALATVAAVALLLFALGVARLALNPGRDRVPTTAGAS